MELTKRDKAEMARARDLLNHFRRVTRDKNYRAVDRLMTWSSSNPNPEVRLASLHAIDALHALLKGHATVEKIDKVREHLSSIKPLH
jgi:glycerate-2-kinase